jgi:hypothetical protein
MKMPKTFFTTQKFLRQFSKKTNTNQTLNKKLKTFFAPFTPSFATHPPSPSQPGSDYFPRKMLTKKTLETNIY